MLKYYEKKNIVKKETQEHKKQASRVVFAQQYKENFQQFLISSIWVSALLILVVVLYPYVRDMYATLPQELADVYASLGGIPSNIAEYFTMEGGQLFLLIGSIIAAILGVNLITKEIKNGSAEFLYSQPIGRSAVYRSKLFVLILNIILFNVIISSFSLVTIYFTEGFSAFHLENYYIYFGMATVLQLIIGFIAFFYAAIARRKASIGAAIGGTFFFYFITMISTIADEVSFLKYATPFTLLYGKESGGNLLTLINNGLSAIDIPNLIIFGGLCILLFAISHTVFKKSDII